LGIIDVGCAMSDVIGEDLIYARKCLSHSIRKS